MTKEEAEKMSEEKVFLHMEVRLAAALDETRKKYGEDAAEFVRLMITAMMVNLMTKDLEGKLPCPVNIVFCAWVETMASWNEQIDEFVKK